MQLYYWKLIENKQNNEQPIPIYDNAEMNELFENSETDSEPWLLEDLNSQDCEYLLNYYRECMRSGTFLIRKSQSNSNIQPYTLCTLYFLFNSARFFDVIINKF
jgi:hypothetical protein